MPLKKARFRISDYNEKQKNRTRREERKIQMVSLSLTSMVDMFAILVIFLLTNSASVSQWIEIGHDIQLPRAKASDVPPKGATIQISHEAVFGDEQRLVTHQQLLGGGATSPVIRGWLSHQRKDGYVNIVAHKDVPFGVIRRVISSCQEAGFQNVNLAVQPKG
jgi:biopolymer transport protein TolR